jgi:hypothetical protein
MKIIKENKHVFASESEEFDLEEYIWATDGIDFWHRCRSWGQVNRHKRCTRCYAFLPEWLENQMLLMVLDQ